MRCEAWKRESPSVHWLKAGKCCAECLEKLPPDQKQAIIDEQRRSDIVQWLLGGASGETVVRRLKSHGMSNDAARSALGQAEATMAPLGAGAQLRRRLVLSHGRLAAIQRVPHIAVSTRTLAAEHFSSFNSPARWRRETRSCALQ